MHLSRSSSQIVTNDLPNKNNNGLSLTVTHLISMSEFLTHVAIIESELIPTFENGLLTIIED